MLFSLVELLFLTFFDTLLAMVALNHEHTSSYLSLSLSLSLYLSIYLYCSEGSVPESIPINEMTVNPGGEKINPQCFSILKVLGKGGYGKVSGSDPLGPQGELDRN